MTVRENYEAIMNFLLENGAPEELSTFIQSRIDQDAKAKAQAKAKREAKNGGVKKDPADSPFYTELRNKVMGVMTADFQSGDALIKASGVTTPSGKAVLAAQVAMALKPAVESGTVVVGEVVEQVTGKDGLKRESLKKGYKLA